MKILVDEMHKKAKDCYLNSYETVFGKSVLVCKLSNNECKLCKHQPCDQLISFKDYMRISVVGIDGTIGI